MRILVLTNRFPRPAQRTVATYNLLQCRAMAKHHDLRIVVPVPWTDEVRDLLRGKPPIREHRQFDGLHVYHPSIVFLPRFFLHTFGPQYLRSVRRTVDRAVRDLRPEAIFCCWAHPDGWAAVQFGRELGIPVLIKVIGSDVLVATKNERRRKEIADTLRAADGVVAVGEDLAANVVKLGVDAARVSVVSEGVEHDVFHAGDKSAARAKLGIPESEKTILYVGNLLVSKGIRLLVDACEIMKREGRAFHCRIVGGGADGAAVQEHARALGLAGDVTFHGASPHDALADWYRACDFLVLPSYSEGIPNVLREVELCGRPYIATRVGGVPEIARPDVSRLVPAGDKDALARAMAEMLERPLVVDAEQAKARHITPAASGQLIIDRLERIMKDRLRTRAP
jgi:glycosyltransferase involved in cell wall biosynthesis